MQIRLLTTLAIPALLGLTSIAAFAADCGDYPLTPEQQQYIKDNALTVIIPDGEVPVIQRCDTNNDGWVDIIDIKAISAKRNQPAAHPDDPMDWNKDSKITLLDARGCQRVCSLPRCAVSETPPPPSAPPAGVVEDGSCFQKTDLDGDGNEDIAAIYEHTGDDNRGGGWNLELVFIYKDAKGNVRHRTNPYSGKRSETKLFQHVSKQPAGLVDLMPGSVTIERPGVVSYRNGVPKVLYYYQDGQMKRAFYGVDD